MDWITVDRDRIVASMSPARRQMYEGWIVQHPEKEARVDELIANLVMEFRCGVEANPRNVLDPDLAKLPQSCVRYCEELCGFEVCQEMGATMMDGELLAVSKAEIFLRYMYSGRFYITGGEGGAESSPSYEPEVERGARLLDG